MIKYALMTLHDLRKLVSNFSQEKLTANFSKMTQCHTVIYM